MFLELLGDKDLNRITVSGICEKAGIHRTTFCGHYQDVYDLMDQMLRRSDLRMQDSFMKQEAPFFMRAGLIRLFEIVRGNRAFFRYDLSHPEINRAVGSTFPDLFVENAQIMKEHLGLKTLEALYCHEVLFKGGLSSLILYGCSRDCAEMQAGTGAEA